MVKCKACGKLNGDNEIFCINCGTLIMTSEYLDNTKVAEDSANITENSVNDMQPLQDKEDISKESESVDAPADEQNNAVKDQEYDNSIQEFYISPDEDELGRAYRRKKMIIISASIVAAIVLIVFAVVGVISLQKARNEMDVKTPSYEQIIKALNKDEKISTVKIDGVDYNIPVTSLEINSFNEDEKTSRYIIDANATRSNDMYKLSPIKCVVTFENKHDVYMYVGTEIEKDYKMTIKAIGGYSVELAHKMLSKDYKKVTLLDQKTNLEKGKDKLSFAVENKSMKGKVVLHYKFSGTKGWKLEKSEMKDAVFGKGVTHQEDGLYTNDSIKNVMFFGIDTESYSGRSDVMMLVSIDTLTKKIKLTSFMRDTYVEIPGYGHNKLNSAFAIGGAEAAVKAIENTYKIKIDNYAATNFTTFKNIINSLGGLKIEITADEAGYINWQLGKNGQTSVGLLSVRDGEVTLNGQQALWLCRNRGGNGFSGDDFARTGRQRRVIQSLIETYDAYSPKQVLDTLNNLIGNVETDLSLDDLKWYAENSTVFFDYSVQGRCAPDHGEWHAGTSPGGSWIIQFNDWNKFLKDVQKDIYEDLE